MEFSQQKIKEYKKTKAKRKNSKCEQEKKKTTGFQYCLQFLSDFSNTEKLLPYDHVSSDAI